MAGILDEITILEFAGISDAPFAGMMLADHGAKVIRIERTLPEGVEAPPNRDILNRSRTVIRKNLKNADDIAEIRALVKEADGIIEGFRPGVMERLGLGPDVFLSDNPRLIYGRMTGWGQTGPMADRAGHDINYISLSGNLHGYGRAGEKPVPPINAVGDFGGGGMMLAFAMVSGILGVKNGASGQVVDCAMVDGAAILNAMTYSFLAQGMWRDERGVNLLDTGAHFYDVYETQDGKYISLGAIEPQFYAAFREAAGLADDPDFDAQMDFTQWPLLTEKLTDIFKRKSRDEWDAIMRDIDSCVAPILSLTEAPEYPHNKERETFVTVDGVLQPAPAPRFSKNAAPTPKMTPKMALENG